MTIEEVDFVFLYVQTSLFQRLSYSSLKADSFLSRSQNMICVTGLPKASGLAIHSISSKLLELLRLEDNSCSAVRQNCSTSFHVEWAYCVLRVLQEFFPCGKSTHVLHSLKHMVSKVEVEASDNNGVLVTIFDQPVGLPKCS